ncbi:MAG: 30S ribosomal protein S8 [Patescibacteria group bacterium]
MVTDPISNFIISLKNAANTGKPLVRVPHSRMKQSIAEVLEREGFIASIDRKGKKARTFIEVELAFDNGIPRVHDVKRLSKPSKRVYYSVRDIVPVKNGYGHIVLSTPQGIMTGVEARKAKVGGEALFLIW